MSSLNKINASKINPTTRPSPASKIYCHFNPNDGVSYDRATIGLYNTEAYRSIFTQISPDTFDESAGVDLTAILYPYSFISNKVPQSQFSEFSYSADAVIPLARPIKYSNLLPYPLSDQETGDTNTDSINFSPGEKNEGDIGRLSDKARRPIGIRLPMIGVGWGHTTRGAPYPKGTTYRKFKGEKDYGWQVDPKDYISAPVDLRYDEVNNVWTCAEDSLWAVITGSDGIKHSWSEITSGANPRKGSLTTQDLANNDFGPALEINGRKGVVKGTIVKLKRSSDSGPYVFDIGWASAGTVTDLDIHKTDTWSIETQGDEFKGFAITFLTRSEEIEDNTLGNSIKLYKRTLYAEGNGHSNFITAEGYDTVSLGDVKVAVDANDSGGYLDEKVVGGMNITTEPFHDPNDINPNIKKEKISFSANDINKAAPADGDLLQFNQAANNGAGEWQAVKSEERLLLAGEDGSIYIDDDNVIHFTRITARIILTDDDEDFSPFETDDCQTPP